MWTVTYNKWTRFLTLYRDGRRLRKRQYTLIDTTQNAIKLGNVGTVYNTGDTYPQDSLEAQIDDFTIWDGEIPWHDDDPETVDVLSLWDKSICYDASPYDVDDDCQIGMPDLLEIADTWLENGLVAGDI